MKKIILGVCVILILCLSISRCAMNNKDNKQDIPEQTQDSVNLTEEADLSSSFLDEEELEDEAFTESFKGRGKGYQPEEYIGLVGYAALEKGYDIHDYTLIEHWEIPTYQQDKQFWVETGALPHKTKVVVKEQLLENTSRWGYSGYLLVERSDTGEQVYIKVKDFVTTPYWLSDDLVQAVRYGNFVANFVQVSDYYPVDNRGHKAELEDATSVLVVDKVGLRTYVDSNETPLEVIVLSGERKGQTVFVNELDLTIVY